MRSSFRKGLIIIGLLAAWAGSALAQDGLYVVPFAGYRWGGSMSTISGVTKFDVDDTWNYGVALDKELGREAAAELYYSHFQGDWHATLVGGIKRSGQARRDDIELNGLWYAYRPGRDVRPYFTAGLGASIFSSDQTSAYGRFAWNIGAGIRKDLNPKAALRLETRWHPTWVTTGSAIYCDPYYYYGCYTVGSGEFFDQIEVTLGLAIRLGGK